MYVEITNIKGVLAKHCSSNSFTKRLQNSNCLKVFRCRKPKKQRNQSNTMAHPEEISTLNKAFSGLGVEEKSLISILTKWHPAHIHSYRKATPDFFKEDERQFHRWLDHHVLQLTQEFIRFKNAVVLRTLHPWERDARLFKEALQNEAPRFDILIEAACTRTSEELLGARKAYHSLFDQSIEEDIASRIHTSERKLLVALVSAYRYEGPRVHEATAKAEAKILHNAIKDAKQNPIEDDKVIMLLSTRSKPHLKAVYKYYKELSGKNLDQDLEGHLILKQTVQCLCIPEAYFSKILDASLRADADEATKDSVTRVILTRADVDMKQIKEEFHHKSGVTLPKKIEEVANGNYRDFLLALVAKDN